MKTSPTPCRRIVVSASLAAILMLVTAACAPVYHDNDAFMGGPARVVTSTDYHLAPPDEIVIASREVVEIDGHREIIRPDGKITLPLLGSVFVAGRTPEDVSQELTQKAHEFYENANVSLRLHAYNSKKIYVFGEVSTPGPYIYDGANTVLELLAESQPTRLADQERILVVRPNRDPSLARLMTIDMKKMVREGDLSLNALLEEGDIIYVAPHALAAVGLAFQQILLPIQPAAATVNAPKSFNQAFRSNNVAD